MEVETEQPYYKSSYNSLRLKGKFLMSATKLIWQENMATRDKIRCIDTQHRIVTIMQSV